MSPPESSGSHPPMWAPSPVLGFVASLVVVAALGGCGKEEAKPQARPPAQVSVITVAPRDMPVTFEFVAQTQSSHQVEIRARVDGFLDRRLYSEGAVVTEGQPLFLMDAKPFQAQVDAAAAVLTRQKAALDTARLNLERVRPLAALNAVSQKDLDDAVGTYEVSAAGVEQAKAQLVVAQLNLSYTSIVSPVAGITGAALQQDGAYINQQNSQLTTVMVLSPMWVNFSVSENELKKFQDQIGTGQLRPPPDQSYVVEVVLVDGTIFPHTGRITFIAPSYSSQTGTFLLRASVDNPNGLLRPSQYVRARVKGAVRPNSILVPQRAVQQGAKGHFIWVASTEGKAEFRPVVVGDWYGNDVFISDGLRAGDQVVVEAPLTLRPGDAVTTRPLASTPPPAAAGATVTGGALKTEK
jgi:membrane fusion protein (multidrug efflux system)